MSDRALERSLEWEPATEPIVMEHVEWPVPPFITGMRKLTVQRDDDLRLTLVAEGILANNDELRTRHEDTNAIPAGTFRDAEETTFRAHGADCALTAFLNDVPDVTLSGDRPGQVQFRQKGHVLRFQRTWTQKFDSEQEERPSLVDLGPPSWRSDWFVNGPHKPLFMRFTKRRRNATFERHRQGAAIAVRELPAAAERRDHFVVDAGSLHFTVCVVPDEFAPAWLHATAIEFAAPIPDKETREAVAEVVSFVFGRRLLLLGSTVFDAEGWPIEEEMINPVADGLRSLCTGSDLSPLPLRIPSSDVERVLASLVPKYLEARSALGLRNALWGYWAACEASAPIDLAIFRAAVEALKKGWFSSASKSSKGVYMAQDEYEGLTTNLIDAVRQGLAGREGASAIVDKIGRAYQMGSNEQVRTFFAEIRLPIGAAEQAAMKAANVPAHGGITTGGDLKKLVLQGRAYRTLFERTFLRLLGFDGPYVDRTTLGFPSRPLEEPAGGRAS